MMIQRIFRAHKRQVLHLSPKREQGKILPKYLSSFQTNFPVAESDSVACIPYLRMDSRLSRNLQGLDIGPDMIDPAPGSAKNDHLITSKGKRRPDGNLRV